MKRIAFLLGSPDISGGTNVIFEHATRLQRIGYEVNILTETVVDATRYAWHPEASGLRWNTIGSCYDTEFDCVVATWWQSVWQLEKLRSRYYLYFVQSIESRFFPESDSEVFSNRDVDIMARWCENTYRFPLPVITEARWIQGYLLEKFNRPSWLVRNGIRKDIFSKCGPCVEERRPSGLRVLVEGPLGVFYKNVEKTIELCLKANVAEIWLLSSSELSDYPGVDRCFSRVPMEKTAEIYRSCDVLVKLSYVEGMFGPPLEMFHCGGTALVYGVTGHDEYIRNGENGIVVGMDREEEVVSWLRKLQDESELLQSLKEEAGRTAEAWPDWDACSRAFADCLETLEAEPPCRSNRFLKEYTSLFISAREDGFRSRELARLAEREQHAGKAVNGCTNYIQVYWDDGQGLGRELTTKYASGLWQECRISVPVQGGTVTLRLDPSVRAGIVAVRKITVTDAVTGDCLLQYVPGSSWEDIYFSGTMVCLRREPYPLLEAFGEDPQMILPQLNTLPGNRGIDLSVEVCEMGFADALYRYSSLAKRTSFGERVANVLKYVMKGAPTL